MKDLFLFFISFIMIIAVAITACSVDNDLSSRVSKLEQYKTSTEPIISGLNDEINELRDITDEFRAQIKGLQKEVLIGIQEGGM